ncbi:MAG: response regulator transcription factor [Pseudomonadaceae bacterium]|nr:response regulator transcription factor [Pseudomonadaceae bacterium]
MNDIKARVLVVDDEPQIRKFLRIGLTHAGYKVDEAETGKSAVRLANALKPDLILLDLGLPELDGQEVIVQLREAGHKQPILVLSVRNDQGDIVEALDHGADDYLTKPFGMEELLARLRTLMRRAVQEQTGGDTIVAIPGLEIDLIRHEVKLNGEAVDLSPKEFRLLQELAGNANKALTHRHLLTQVWGPAHTDNQQYLRVYMGQLRKKLAVDGVEPEYLRTLQGVGYIFDTTVVDGEGDGAA